MKNKKPKESVEDSIMKKRFTFDERDYLVIKDDESHDDEEYIED